MWSVLVSGIGLGLAIAILVGPVFFLIINTAINKGFIQAFFVALGVAICDSFYILLLYFGFNLFEKSYLTDDVLKIAGGVLLIIYGLVMVFKKVKIDTKQLISSSKKDKMEFFVKGFLLNAFNPSVILFWMASVSAASIQMQYNGWYILLFFTCCVLTILLTDILKIYLSVKLSNKITPRILYIINVISGIAMILYGIYLFF